MSKRHLPVILPLLAMWQLPLMAQIPIIPSKTVEETRFQVFQGGVRNCELANFRLHLDYRAATARHVQQEITYKAIEFGVRARRPNTGPETIRLRYGDCKDTALLLHLLLRAAGIESHLALVNTDCEIQPDLPTPEQLNHMVVHVPSLGKYWLLDATDKTLALTLFPADALWHTLALILDPKRPQFIPLPAPPAQDSSRVGVLRTVTIEENDWRVEETLTLTGYYASWMRAAFTGISPTGQHDKAQGILAGQGTAQLHDFRFENIDEHAEPCAFP